ncbi:ABC transporter permease subunit [Burkholderia multivorans]|uniref:ABC transporter permease subunit n=1 Tax=Burkholderia multivorans TaxID=87883 RepID=UPI0021BF2D07|nr:ABC transporter permease subunit [Burkholderia multivorans]MDR8763330.1 putative aliphatic sulfonates transport permease protein SsuC [Burkholderia multivorans]MDR8768985.1 putative aliphatic sulfonates transport permease protein SsuC [Burkholderia multivorans]MDR8774899.1 putative aliphatic sulfonates transport permease protein SsuC [Burkholderia multivorans]MDR8792511.1 putative aliphatic sulfonates transport permease protein SsuC [Burkholderia multivorans]MDR8798630.1 putative aliphatic 
MSVADSSTGIVSGHGLTANDASADDVRGRPRRSRLRPHHISIATVALLIVAWEVVTRLQVVSPVFMPSPLAVARKFITVAVDGSSNATLLQHTLASLGRVFAALGLAVVTAVPLGVLTGLNRTAQAIADPLIEFYRPVPPLAYLPLIVIWCGIGEPSKILLIWLAIFAPLTIATQQGVRRVKTSRLRGAQALGATRWQLIRYIIVPSAAPDVLTGIRISLGVGWSVLVAAELIAATRGLGFMIQSAAQFLETDVVVMGIIVIALIAAAFEWGLRRLQKALVPWDGHA